MSSDHDKGFRKSIRSNDSRLKFSGRSTTRLAEQSKAVYRQELMCILANLGILATGIGLALPAVTLNQLTDPNEAVHLDMSQASWYASGYTITCPLGSILAAIFMDRIGRKRTLIAVNGFAIIAWALMALAVYDDCESLFIQLMISRCITGISIGMGSSASGVYGAEISFPRIRGRLILGASVAVAAGTLFTYILGYFIRDNWRLIAMILLGYQIFCVFAIIPIPETPSWLLLKGKIKKAKKSLIYFRGLKDGQSHEEVELEFFLLHEAIVLEAEEGKPSFFKSLHEPQVYKPLLIMIGFFCCQQLSGIFVVIVYAVQFAIDAGVTLDPFLCAVFVGIARLVTTCMMGWLLEIWGRRLCGMISALGMFICMFLLAGSGRFPWLDIPYLQATAIVIYMITGSFGLYTLPFFMVSEVFPRKFRGPCTGITTCFGFLMSFFALKEYPSMVDEMGSRNVFAFYGVASFLSIIFVYFFLPETKDRTLMEIEDYFRYGEWDVRENDSEEELDFKK